MATLAVGAVVSVFCPLSGTMTVTPGTSGRVSINARGRDGSQSIAARELYNAETLTVTAGDTVGLEAINAAATYTDPAESGPAIQALVLGAGISDVAYDGSGRVASYTANSVAHAVAYPTATSAVITNNSGASRTVAFDSLGRVSSIV